MTNEMYQREANVLGADYFERQGWHPPKEKKDDIYQLYEKQKEINKELVDENEALKFAARMSEKTEKQLREKNKDLADCNSRLLTQVAAATKRIIQLEKDNWHDLRKDPKDLPDEGTYLVVWSNARGYKARMIMRYEEDDEEELHWIDGDGDCWDDDVIAWREIPEFEEADV